MADAARGLDSIPEVLAIIICNEVIEDKHTNNKTLVGLFNGITVRSLPAFHSRICVVASLTGIIGEMPIGIRIMSPSDVVADVKGKTNSEDGEVVLDLVVEFRDLPLKEEGTHRVEVYAGNVALAGRNFTVVKMPQPMS